MTLIVRGKGKYNRWPPFFSATIPGLPRWRYDSSRSQHLVLIAAGVLRRETDEADFDVWQHGQSAVPGDFGRRVTADEAGFASMVVI